MHIQVVMRVWKSVIDRILSCQENAFEPRATSFIFMLLCFCQKAGNNWAIDPSSMCTSCAAMQITPRTRQRYIDIWSFPNELNDPWGPVQGISVSDWTGSRCGTELGRGLQ